MFSFVKRGLGSFLSSRVWVRVERVNTGEIFRIYLEYMLLGWVRGVGDMLFFVVLCVVEEIGSDRDVYGDVRGFIVYV